MFYHYHATSCFPLLGYNYSFYIIWHQPIWLCGTDGQKNAQTGRWSETNFHHHNFFVYDDEPYICITRHTCTMTWWYQMIQYIPRNMHTVFALLCFVVVIHWMIFPYPSGLLHWHCGNLTIAPVPAKQPWWIWINTSCEFIMNDCITTTKQSTTKPCAYFLGYTVGISRHNLDMCSPEYILEQA